MALSNTPAGALAAIPLLPSAVAAPFESFLLVSQGQFTANGASSVTVANANITANSQVIITLATVGGTVGAVPTLKTVTVGTGFTVAGTASDTSVYSYMIIG